jgi:perosamine synthetase
MIDAIAKVISSGYINRGKQAALFEEMFREKFGYKNALSINSCTSTLRLAYDLAKLYSWKRMVNEDKAKEVITTPYTMVATNTAILECGLKPVFVDIDYETGNIDWRVVEDYIESHDPKNIIAMVGVDYAGYPCNWFQLQCLGARWNIYTIQDAAQALGATIDGKPIGRFSDMTCFSFQAIKHITTGDGGMFVSTNSDIAYRAIEKIWFGINKEQRINDELGAYPYDIGELGYKYGMNDIAATMGIDGLLDLDSVLAIRQLFAQQYREELEGIKGIELMRTDKGFQSANWMFPIHVEERRKFAKLMREKGIEVAVHNWRNDQYTVFGGKQDLPNTERFNNDVIHIPLHAELSQENVEYIISTIKGLRWI